MVDNALKVLQCRWVMIFMPAGRGLQRAGAQDTAAEDCHSNVEGVNAQQFHGGLGAAGYKSNASTTMIIAEVQAGVKNPPH
jgi:hypothetical protein